MKRIELSQYSKWKYHMHEHSIYVSKCMRTCVGRQKRRGRKKQRTQWKIKKQCHFSDKKYTKVVVLYDYTGNLINLREI